MPAYSPTFTDLMDEACNQLGLVRTQLDDTQTTRLKGWPNEAVDLIARAREWPHYKAFATIQSASEDFALLPDDFRELARNSSIRCTSHTGYPLLESMTIGQLEEFRITGDTTGPPYWYAMGPTAEGGQRRLELWPKASAEFRYRIMYHRQATAMVASNDKPDIPDECNSLISTATKLIAERRQRGHIHRDLQAMYDRELNEAWEAQSLPDKRSDGALRAVIARDIHVRRGRNMQLTTNYPDRD